MSLIFRKSEADSWGTFLVRFRTDGSYSKGSKAVSKSHKVTLASDMFKTDVMAYPRVFASSIASGNKTCSAIVFRFIIPLPISGLVIFMPTKVSERAGIITVLGTLVSLENPMSGFILFLISFFVGM